jgi:hypothetical protein
MARDPVSREGDGERRKGLAAVEASRAERNRVQRPSLRVAIWFAITVAVAMVLYFRYDSGQVESQRSKLLSKQRAAEATFGERWYPIRDKVEAWAVELGAAQQPDLIEKEELASFKFQELPGMYLRARVDQVETPEAVRAGALKSLRDGFTACLMHAAPDPTAQGKECTKSMECEPGQICNEFLTCSRPGQPYNLRLAYKALFVLTPEWVREVQLAKNDLMLRGLDLSFEDASKIEFPIAADLLTRAKFFLAVIDERPAPPPHDADAGPAPEDLEAIDGKSYPARIGLWRFSDGKQLLRLRLDSKAELMGGSPISDPSVAAARARQARSCALAMDVRRAIGDLK